MPLNARTKGVRGELEACKRLKKILELDYMPERNLDQVRKGGCDINIKPSNTIPIYDDYDFDERKFIEKNQDRLLIEVKRQEKLDYNTWWKQVAKASKTTELIPVVMFRQNHKKWEYLISAKAIGGKKGWLHINEFRFIEYAKSRLRI